MCLGSYDSYQSWALDAMIIGIDTAVDQIVQSGHLGHGHCSWPASVCMDVSGPPVHNQGLRRLKVTLKSNADTPWRNLRRQT